MGRELSEVGRHQFMLHALVKRLVFAVPPPGSDVEWSEAGLAEKCGRQRRGAEASAPAAIKAVRAAGAQLVEWEITSRRRKRTVRGFVDGPGTPWIWNLCDPRRVGTPRRPRWGVAFAAVRRFAYWAPEHGPVIETVFDRAAYAADADGVLGGSDGITLDELGALLRVDGRTALRALTRLSDARNGDALSLGVREVEQVPKLPGDNRARYRITLELPAFRDARRATAPAAGADAGPIDAGQMGEPDLAPQAQTPAANPLPPGDAPESGTEPQAVASPDALPTEPVRDPPEPETLPLELVAQGPPAPTGSYVRPPVRRRAAVPVAPLRARPKGAASMPAADSGRPIETQPGGRPAAARASEASVAVLSAADAREAARRSLSEEPNAEAARDQRRRDEGRRLLLEG